MTSSAVSGVPSLQVSPERSFRVYSLGPVQPLDVSASHDADAVSGRLMTAIRAAVASGSVA